MPTPDSCGPVRITDQIVDLWDLSENSADFESEEVVGARAEYEKWIWDQFKGLGGTVMTDGQNLNIKAFRSMVNFQCREMAKIKRGKKRM